MTLLMSDQGKGMESANNDARKWPILPFDVSRDHITSEQERSVVKTISSVSFTSNVKV
jgi:hypothetical protein